MLRMRDSVTMKALAGAGGDSYDVNTPKRTHAHSNNGHNTTPTTIPRAATIQWCVCTSPPRDAARPCNY
ncbi:hypothetical protein J6590_017090 [Homalodisca vitripennis]|nr:hypothetical protein J6590_017090 [Homalodisca vitripennis]